MKPEEIGKRYEELLEEEIRKRDGIYYTPQYIVDYIIENTIGKLVESKTPEEVTNIKIVDPACGSGVFLSGAYQFLLDWYEKKIGKLSCEQRKRILINNIFGIDIDPIAVGFTKYALQLKCMENVHQKHVLPNFDGNILCGNALISDPNVDKERAFHWQNTFPDIFRNGGFDIVIGNPPYVEHKKMKKRAAELKGKFEVFSGTADLSVYFIEQGVNLCNENGQVMFITTNKFFNAGYGALVRKWILKHQIHTLINFEQVKVFETALVSSVILGIKPKKTKDEFTFHQFSKLNRKEFYKQFAELKKNVGTFQQSQLGQGEWTFADNAERELKAKIEKKGRTLGKVGGVAIYRGVTTGYNPAFIIDETKAEELIQEDKKNAEIIKPLLQGRNIRKWIYNDNKDFLIFTQQGIDIDDYPKIKKHLQQFRKQLKPGSKGGRKDGSYQWYEIQDITAYYPQFEKEKIIWGLTADKWAFAYDDKGHYLPSNGYILTSKKVPLKYLLGLLNSKVLQYYFKFIGVMTAGGAFTLKHATITQLPVVIAENTQPLVNLVERRLNGEDVDGKIDALVYELYALTAAEIGIIEH
ncbi:hypothetical protein FACS1894189_8810 [Planctomycetales bacterium]|nr:hypothetical protein FACS1894189_8810 [Planctomycetales bacterium]